MQSSPNHAPNSIGAPSEGAMGPMPRGRPVSQQGLGGFRIVFGGGPIR
jgi:hypothetical protein